MQLVLHTVAAEKFPEKPPKTTRAGEKKRLKKYLWIQFLSFVY